VKRPDRKLTRIRSMTSSSALPLSHNTVNRFPAFKPSSSLQVKKESPSKPGPSKLKMEDTNTSFVKREADTPFVKKETTSNSKPGTSSNASGKRREVEVDVIVLSSDDAPPPEPEHKPSLPWHWTKCPPLPSMDSIFHVLSVREPGSPILELRGPLLDVACIETVEDMLTYAIQEVADVINRPVLDVMAFFAFALGEATVALTQSTNDRAGSGSNVTSLGLSGEIPIEISD